MRKTKLATGLKNEFNYGKVATSYNKFRKPFPDNFFSILKEKGLIDPGKKILELGAGTGAISRAIATMEPKCSITALDCSQGMLDEASIQDKKLGINNITYQCAPAEKTGLKNNAFDLIIAGRCWHWFKQEEAIEEIKRVSKPKATFVIANYDPMLEDDNPLDTSTTLIHKYDSIWKLPIEKELQREYRYADQLMKKDFSDVQLHIFLEQQLISQKEWVNFINTTSGVGGNNNLSKEQVKSFNEEHAKLLEKKYGKNKKLNQKYTVSTIFSNVPVQKAQVKQEQKDTTTTTRFGKT